MKKSCPASFAYSMLLLIIYLFCFPAHAAEHQRKITLAIFPCADVISSYKSFYPLSLYLKLRTGYNVDLVIPKDFVEFEKIVSKNQADFTIQPPYTYIKLARLYRRDSLLRTITKNGSLLHRAVVFVRRDSGITRIEELRNKLVIFGLENSAEKWHAAKILFQEKGLELGKNVNYSTNPCCEDAAISVYLRTADAGVICDYSFESLYKNARDLGIRPEQLVVIGKTGPLPTWVFAARRNIDDDLMNRINDALVKMNGSNSEISFENFVWGGFLKAKDTDFDDVRDLIYRKKIRKSQ